MRIHFVAETSIAAAEGTTPTFSMTLYNGGPIMPSGWPKQHPLVVELSGMSVVGNGVIPFNRGHDGDDALVGHGTPVITAEDIRVIDGVFSFENDAVREIVSASKRGFPWSSSMEATLLDTPEFVASGRTVRVNNRTIAGPVYIARRTELFAGAFIGSNPADKTTSVSIAAEQKMDDNLKQWLEGKSISCEGLTDDQIAFYQEAYDKTVKAQDTVTVTDPPPHNSVDIDVVGDIRAKAAEEHTRIDMIARHCGSRYTEIKAKAINEGWSEDKVELAVLKAKAEEQKELDKDRADRPHGPAIHGSNSEELRTTEIFAAALHQAACPEMRHSQFIADEYGEKNAELSAKLPKNIGLHYACYQVMRAAGMYVEPGVGWSDEMLRQTVKAERILQARTIQASAGFSNLALTDTLSNLANKMLLAEYQRPGSLVERICSVAEHADFKEHTKVSVLGEGELKQTPPTGRIDHLAMSDTKYTNIIYQWAGMLAISRVDFFNDDLGAFSRGGRELGRIAMKSREKLMWATILDTALNNAFFKTAAQASGDPLIPVNHLTATALNAAGLGAAEELLWKMVDEGGDPVVVMGDALITGPVLAHDAEALINYRTVIDSNEAAGTAQNLVENQFNGRFEPLMSRWLAANRVTGGADTIWFLLGDRGDAAAFEYARLRGSSSPTLDTDETDFSTLGFQSRVYWDYGFNDQNPRGIVKVETV